jgi:hypothetical protein
MTANGAWPVDARISPIIWYRFGYKRSQCIVQLIPRIPLSYSEINPSPSGPRRGPPSAAPPPPAPARAARVRRPRPTPATRGRLPGPARTARAAVVAIDPQSPCSPGHGGEAHDASHRTYARLSFRARLNARIVLPFRSYSEINARHRRSPSGSRLLMPHSVRGAGSHHDQHARPKMRFAGRIGSACKSAQPPGPSRATRLIPATSPRPAPP